MISVARIFIFVLEDIVSYTPTYDCSEIIFGRLARPKGY